MSYIVFVGDKPSSKNLDPKIPFVGTRSYKTLLNWIIELNIDISNVILCNKDNFKIDYTDYIVEKHDSTTYINSSDKIIALGKNASKYLKLLGCNHFEMDHPSGMNRNLNCPKYIKDKLNSCKKYIDGV